LHVFFPPIAELDDYLDLVLAVEETARELDLRVRIEGYTPPNDRRLLKLSVTPDPGVIEVNIHPSRTFADLSKTTTALYEEARLCELGTEKFMLDGRHSGTGGGNRHWSSNCRSVPPYALRSEEARCSSARASQASSRSSARRETAIRTSGLNQWRAWTTAAIQFTRTS
jgi:hypothetical protein